MDTDKYMEELKGLLKNGNGPGAIEHLVKEILSNINAKESLRYESENSSDVKILTTTGRVLVTLSEYPEITQRALAVYIDVSEGVVTNIIKDLIDNNLITKTKVRRQNHYSLNVSEVEKHADIRHLVAMVAGIQKDKK
jgi:DNA-binding MarR family transcriptional regulator